MATKKTMFTGSNSEVAREWVKQHWGRGKSYNGNFSFEGPVLISYRTKIGCIYQPEGKGAVALLTTYNHSKTTSGKHANPAWSSAHYNLQGRVFNVPDFMLNTGHEANLATFVDGYRQACNDIAKARVSVPLHYYVKERVGYTMDKLSQYCAAFGISRPEEFYVEWYDAAVAKWEARLEKYNTPSEVEKRKRREAKQMLHRLIHGDGR